MSKSKFTPWFSGEQMPVRPGLYQVVVYRTAGSVYPRKTELRFNGNDWSHTLHSSNGDFVGSYARMSSNDKWRGLAENPQEKLL